ncbi:hemolysin family protein [Gorillibacterium timonense]|uniref:hemolysin family protein n=1 Tax=Gorillibacterium timonense TaxID=1689269 RepID=UPI00071DE94F|nr:hemolysin family protein [Gorillibacterium timonense]
MDLHLDWGKIAWNLALVLVLVGINAFFVSAEFALVKMRRTRLQELVNQGSGKAKYAIAVTNKLDTYLSASQLGITLASLGIGYVGEPAIAELIFDPILAALHVNNSTLSHVLSFLATFSTITTLHIVLGEQAPKYLAIQRAEGTSLFVSGPLIVFNKLFRPIIWGLNAASNGVLKLLKVDPASEHEAHTEEEIRIMLGQSAKSGHINKDELALFDNIFEFSDRLAREVMLPRTDMVCLYTDLPMEENLKIIYETKHTRYPVAVEEKDRIIGFVHITDILTATPEKLTDLRNVLRPILTIPESIEVSQALKLMQKKHSQLVIVVDEYGGTAGILTIEDILEEIVGDLHDEFDNDERPEIELKGDTISADGRVLLEELAPLLGFAMDDDEVDSIGGWLFKKLEGVPVEGSKVEYRDRLFEVAEMDRFRIIRVSITKVLGEPESELPETMD